MERIGLIYKEINNSISYSLLLESQLKARLVKNLDFSSILIAINNEQKRLFLISLSKIIDKDIIDNFPAWNGIAIYQKKMYNPLTTQENWFLIFEQKEFLSTVIFEYLVEDVISFIIDSDNLSKLLSKLKKVLLKWQYFFTKNTSKILTEQLQQGLFGELIFLHQLLITTNHPRKVLTCWYGTDKEKVDFQIDNIGVEIKTSSSGKPYKVTISAEDQLETKEDQDLYLYCIMLEKSNRIGKTILDLINDIKSLLDDYPEVLADFSNKLFTLGIIEPILKEQRLKKFNIKDSFFYTIIGDFPRITSSNLPRGVLNVKYQLSLESCNSFQIQEELVLYKVKDVIL